LITSNDNEKLKRVRKLGSRKWRDRESAFVSEGEDLLAAGLAAGWKPLDVLVPAGSEIDGTEVEPHLLDGVSTLGSGTRVIAVWTIPAAADLDTFVIHLHGVGDPGNVGTIIRTANSLAGARASLGAGTADPYSPKAVRASMGAIFEAQPVRGDLATLPRPRLGLVADGGAPIDDAIGDLGSVGTLVLGAEREGLPDDVVAQCDATATIPLREEAESLNVAAAAAIGVQRIVSVAPVLPVDGGD